jgi:hypothetical protein
MRIWFFGAVLLGVPIFVLTFWDLIRTRQRMDGELVGLLVPPALIVFGALFPRFGLWLGRYEEERILEFLQVTLVAFPLLDRPEIPQ